MTAVVQRVVHEVDATVRTHASDGLTANMRDRTVVPCALRLGKPDDLAFVVDSWIKHAHRRERPRVATAHVRALLARETAALFVAHVPGEPDAILGWAVLESGRPSCLHYIYTRSSARRMGIARALLSGVVDQAIEYSAEPPRGLRVPGKWTLNLTRSETKP